MYYGSYRSYSDPSGALIAFAIIAFVLAILSVIFITPRSRKPYLNGFFSWLHGVFNFDALLIDKILKFLYIFSTFFVILEGFVILFSGYVWWLGLLMIFAGPFLVRLMYEGLMLGVILVRNVIEINRKMGGAAAPEAAAPARPEPRTCPACGARLKPDATFCGNCGTKL